MRDYEGMSKGALIALLRASEEGRFPTPVGKMARPSHGRELDERVHYEVSREPTSGLGKCYSHADFYDFAPIGFVIFDARGVIREINLAASAMLGRERSLLVNTPFISHIVKSDRKKFLCHLARCRQNEGKVVSTISVSMERGNFFHLQLQSIVGRDLLRDAPFYLTALVDVSELAELRSLAEGLTRNEEKLRQGIAAELQEELARLSTVQAKLGTLACSANSFNRMDDAAVGETVDLALSRVKSLVRRIWPADTEGTTLEGALSTLVEVVREEDGVPAEFQCDMGAASVDMASSATIFQVVRELLGNAARYAQAKRIVISLTMKKGNIAVKVEDNGMGLDPDRVIGSAEKSGGVGLRNSKRRIENIGGAMQIDSAPNSGTSITLLVPLKERKRESGGRGDVRESEALPARIGFLT